EVSGRDRPGLLAALSAGLAELGVSVVSANVESIGERAMDGFYAVEGNGEEILSPKRRDAIKERLLEAIAQPEAPAAGGQEATGSGRAAGGGVGDECVCRSRRAFPSLVREGTEERGPSA